MEKVGIKEYKEAWLALEKIMLVITKNLKDGFQLHDIIEIISPLVKDPDIKKGLEGISHLPAEMKDLDPSEGIEMGALALNTARLMVKEIMSGK